MLKMTVRALAALTVITMTSAASAELPKEPVPFEGYAPISLVQYEKIIAVLKTTKDHNGNPNFLPSEESPDSQDYMQTLPIRQLAYDFAAKQRLLPTDCSDMDCFDARFRELNKITETMSTTNFLIRGQHYGLHIPTAQGQSIPMQSSKPLVRANKEEPAEAVTDPVQLTEAVPAYEAEIKTLQAQLTELSNKETVSPVLVERMQSELSALQGQLAALQKTLDGEDGKAGLVAKQDELQAKFASFNASFNSLQTNVQELLKVGERVTALEKLAEKFTWRLFWILMAIAVIALIVIASLFKLFSQGKQQKVLGSRVTKLENQSTDAKEVRRAESSVTADQLVKAVTAGVGELEAKLNTSFDKKFEEKLNRFAEKIRAESSSSEPPVASETKKDVAVVCPPDFRKSVRDSQPGEFKNYTVTVDGQAIEIAVANVDGTYCQVQGVEQMHGKPLIDTLPSKLKKAGNDTAKGPTGRIVGTNVRRLDTSKRTG